MRFRDFSRPTWAVVVLTLLCAAVPCAATDLPEDFEARTSAIIAAALADDWAYEHLGQLCDDIGHRLQASPGMHAAVDWAEGVMREEGFDRVWTEEVTVAHWIRGKESARLLEPAECDMPILGLGRSIGTPPGGITAEALVVTDFEELAARGDEAAGRIVVFDPPWRNYGYNVKFRGAGADSASTYGAIACLVRSPASGSLATPHTGVMRYGGDVPRIPAACLSSEDAGRLHRLAERGITPRIHLEMSAQNLPDAICHNVLGEITGREAPDEIVLVGGHLDSWDTGTGAHDDGAGCLIMLGAVRLLNHLGMQPRRSIRVVLFTAEEFGGTGGKAYRDLHADELPKHVVALEADSGAFAPRGFSVRAGGIADLDDKAADALTAAVVERLLPLTAPLAAVGAETVSAGWAGVDIGPIVEEGVPGVGHRTHSDDYFLYHHSPADTFDKIDAEALARNVAAAAALIWTLAEMPERLQAWPAD